MKNLKFLKVVAVCLAVVMVCCVYCIPRAKALAATTVVVGGAVLTAAMLAVLMSACLNISVDWRSSGASSYRDYISARGSTYIAEHPIAENADISISSFGLSHKLAIPLLVWTWIRDFISWLTDVDGLDELSTTPSGVYSSGVAPVQFPYVVIDAVGNYSRAVVCDDVPSDVYLIYAVYSATSPGYSSSQPYYFLVSLSPFTLNYARVPSSWTPIWGPIPDDVSISYQLQSSSTRTYQGMTFYCFDIPGPAAQSFTDYKDHINPDIRDNVPSFTRTNAYGFNDIFDYLSSLSSVSAALPEAGTVVGLPSLTLDESLDYPVTITVPATVELPSDADVEEVIDDVTESLSTAVADESVDVVQPEIEPTEPDSLIPVFPADGSFAVPWHWFDDLYDSFSPGILFYAAWLAVLPLPFMALIFAPFLALILVGVLSIMRQH